MAIQLPAPLTGQITPVAVRLSSPVTGQNAVVAATLPSPVTGEITPVALRIGSPFTGESGPSTLNVTMSGGVGVSGGATIANDPMVMKGGARVTGTATVVVNQTTHAEIYPLGGVTVSGSAVVSSNWVEYRPSGGVKITGSARMVNAECMVGGVQLTGAAVVGAITSSAAGALPRITLEAEAETTLVTSGSVEITLPSITSAGSATNGSVGSASTSLPRMTCFVAGGSFAASATLPRLAASASGFIGVVGAGDARIPRMTVSAAANGAVSGQAALKLSSVGAAAVGITGVVGAVAASLGKLAVSSSSTLGVRATVAGHLPSLGVGAQLAQQVSGSVNLRLPRISAQLTAEYVEQLILTFVTNTLTNASTTFSQYPFNSFCEIDGKYYAAASDGLYQIDVDQADVAYKMRSGYCTHKMPVQKHASDFYMNMHSAGDITLRVSVDEGPQYAYVLSPEDISALRQRRALLGKGLRGVYWQFEIAGTKDFDFDNYTVAFAPTARRV